MCIDLKGKNALVVGGTSYIGSCVVKTLLNSDANVIFTGTALSEPRTKENRMKKKFAHYIRYRIGQDQDLKELTKAVRRIFCERLHILIYVPGPVIYKTLSKTSLSELNRLFTENLFGFFEIYKAMDRFLGSNDYARIVAFTCAGSEYLSAKKLMPAYFAAKSALLSILRSLAYELSERKITVNAIAPGIMEGARIPTSRARRKLPSGRKGTCKDIATVLELILSPESGYLTGSSFVVSGGYGV